MLEQFADGCEILLNPTADEMKKALAKVQRRAHKNLLTVDDALAVYRRVALEGAHAAHASVQDCPRSFAFAITSTVIQVARLTDGLIGCSIGRRQLQPGQKGSPPVSADPYDNPRLWLKQVVSAFWTHLDDPQIAALEQEAVTIAMQMAAASERKQSHEHSAARAGVKRRLQLQALFKRSQPGYTSELALALSQVAAMMKAQSLDRIDWRTFKQRWPSIATRYKRDLLGLFKAGSATAAELAGFRDRAAKYCLSFTTWAGAQTVFPSTQIVFQVCSDSLSDAEGHGHRSTFPLRRALREMAQTSPHPVTPQTVGWLRVHMDDLHRLCFVDEVQSDVMEHLLSLSGGHNKDQAAAGLLLKEFADWQVHGFSTVQAWAQSIGYRVGIHSQASAALIEGKTPSERKWNTYYGLPIKRFGLTETQLPGYPAEVFVGS